MAFYTGNQFPAEYRNQIFIADAALYLKSSQPDLNITNPYELDDEQFSDRGTPKNCCEYFMSSREPQGDPRRKKDIFLGRETCPSSKKRKLISVVRVAGVTASSAAIETRERSANIS